MCVCVGQGGTVSHFIPSLCVFILFSVSVAR